MPGVRGMHERLAGPNVKGTPNNTWKVWVVGNLELRVVS